MKCSEEEANCGETPWSISKQLHCHRFGMQFDVAMRHVLKGECGGKFCWLEFVWFSMVVHGYEARSVRWSDTSQ